MKARPRAMTRKTEEAVDRRQNNGSVTAVSPRNYVAIGVLRSCCSTAVRSRFTRTMSVAITLVLSNN